MVIYVHVLVIIPDGRVLLQRIVYKWEATISRVCTSFADIEETAENAISVALGLDPKVNKLEHLAERYGKNKENYTVVYIVRLKSGDVVSCGKQWEVMAVALEELAKETSIHSYKFTDQTLYIIEVLRELRVVARVK